MRLIHDDGLSAPLRLAALTGEAAHLVGYVLRNANEGQADSSGTRCGSCGSSPPRRTNKIVSWRAQ
jgi:hypothetical protein